jgi:hypothetical protein
VSLPPINKSQREAKARRAANNPSDVRCCVEWHISVSGEWRALALYSLSLKIAKKDSEGKRRLHLPHQTFKAVLGMGSDSLRAAIDILVQEGFWIPTQQGGIRKLPDGRWKANRRERGKQLLADEYEIVEHKSWAAAHPNSCFDTMPLSTGLRTPNARKQLSFKRDKYSFTQLFARVRAEVRNSTEQSVFFPRQHTVRLQKLINDYTDDQVVKAAVTLAEKHCGSTFNWKGFSGYFLSVGGQLLEFFRRKEEQQPRLIIQEHPRNSGAKALA